MGWENFVFSSFEKIPSLENNASGPNIKKLGIYS